MPLHSTLPRHSIEPCHLYSVDAIMPGLPYNWQPTCAKFHSAEWWKRAGKISAQLSLPKLAAMNGLTRSAQMSAHSVMHY